MRPIVIAVRIQDNGHSMEEITASKHWPIAGTIFGIPYRKTITKQLFAFSVDFKLYL